MRRPLLAALLATLYFSPLPAAAQEQATTATGDEDGLDSSGADFEEELPAERATPAAVAAPDARPAPMLGDRLLHGS